MTEAWGLFCYMPVRFLGQEMIAMLDFIFVTETVPEILILNPSQSPNPPHCPSLLTAIRYVTLCIYLFLVCLSQTEYKLHEA